MLPESLLSIMLAASCTLGLLRMFPYSSVSLVVITYAKKKVLENTPEYLVLSPSTKTAASTQKPFA